jgi:hypothetical protein
MKKTHIIYLFTLLSLLAASCAKTEDDPDFTLRSRKARLTGEWKVTKASGADISPFDNYTWEYDGNTHRKLSPANEPPQTHTYKYVFEKNGDYTFEMISTASNGDKTTTTTKGIWNFTEGVGKQEKKTQLILEARSLVSTSTSDPMNNYTMTYTGNDNHIVFDLLELRNNMMRWKMEEAMGSTMFEGYAYSEEWTLERE